MEGGFLMLQKPSYEDLEQRVMEAEEKPPERNQADESLESESDTSQGFMDALARTEVQQLIEQLMSV